MGDILLSRVKSNGWKQRISASKKGKKRSPDYRLWTQEEIDKLREIYPNCGLEELSIIFSRPTLSIWMKARKLGLKTLRPKMRRSSWAFIKGNPYKEVLSDKEFAYLAGIFDGEGYLSVDRKGYWRLGIGNTHRPLIDWLANKIKHTRVKQHRRIKETWKLMWYWELSDNIKIKALLDILLPYLIVKKKKATEALSAIKLRESL